MCLIPGCPEAAAGSTSRHHYGNLCHTHRWRARRNGDPLQETIKARELAPYIALMLKRQRTDPGAKAWTVLSDRWDALAETCRATMRAALGGQPMSRWERQAAEEIVRVAGEAAPEAVWRTVIALYMLREDQPRRFANDAAFLVQISLRVRKLASSNRDAFYDSRSGRTKYALRDANVRVAGIMGAMLRETFGVAGVHFSRQEQVEEERRKAERNAFYDALREAAPDGMGL